MIQMHVLQVVNCIHLACLAIYIRTIDVDLYSRDSYLH